MNSELELVIRRLLKSVLLEVAREMQPLASRAFGRNRKNRSSTNVCFCVPLNSPRALVFPKGQFTR